MISQQELITESRRNLGVYAVGLNHQYRISQHIKRLTLALMMVEQKLIDRLMIVMPPRHSKSLSTSEIFPSWYLGKRPDNQMILASYANALAWKFGRNVLFNMHSPIFKQAFDIHLDPKITTRIEIPNHQGTLHTAGITGGFTGRGADVFIIDDPIKDAAQASSPAYLDKLYDWYTSTALTRLSPTGAMIIIQTRWVEDDLVGRILSSSTKDRWHILHMPAIDDNGNALWPDQFPLERLLQIKAAVGDRVWQALYQGNPLPSSGNLIDREWITFTSYMPSEVEVVRFWDFASTLKGDYTAGVLMARDRNNRYYVIDVKRFQLTPAKRNELVRSICEQDYQKWGSRYHIYFEQEGGASGIDMRDSIIKLLAGLPVSSEIPRGNKLSRFDPVRSQMEIQNIVLARADWNDEYIKEILGFPFAKNDDQVDATSGAFNALARKVSNFYEYLQSRYGIADPDSELIEQMFQGSEFDNLTMRLKDELEIALTDEQTMFQEVIKAGELNKVSKYGLADERDTLQMLIPVQGTRALPLNALLKSVFKLSLRQAEQDFVIYEDKWYIVDVPSRKKELIAKIHDSGICKVEKVI